jgi:hypothetical protein
MDSGASLRFPWLRRFAISVPEEEDWDQLCASSSIS